jgi:prepilin-type N-terminal cleavage/methylation domain-containing protein
MRKDGFTLAELLIALAILGVIATFTIPKVLNSQQDSKFKAIEKEAVASVSAAWQQVKMKGADGNTNIVFGVLNSNLNYVRKDSVTVIDEWHGANTRTCLINQCYLLHNGAMIWADPATFGGTASTNAVSFWVDPDGKVTDGTTNGPGKGVLFYLYYDGKVRTRGTLVPNTCDNGQCWATPNPPEDPPWFSWD